ncbi:MAG: methionine--tRNA ligase subunit beta, partial [Pseudomonadales bacterium]
LLDHQVDVFKPLFTRMEKKDLDKVVDASKETQSGADDSVSVDSDQISIDDFAKIDLRVAKIIAADPVDGADKLLQLTLNLGDSQRQVFAGIKTAYEPASLVGRLCVVVANLAPRKMRFGISEGMVLAAGPGNENIFLLSPDSGAEPGMIVR